MASTPPNLVANGDIRPFRFVKHDSSAAHKGLECDANDLPCGIAGGSTNQPPLTDLVLTALHASADQHIRLYGEGDETLLELGDTVANGGRIKSDADGKGVPILTTGTTNQNYGAQALEDGVAGEKIRVQVLIGTHRPALT